MNKYRLKIKLLSDTIIGSAEGYGSVIDTDVIFDEIGLPYIPAKRVKGVLRDSAVEIVEMLSLFGIKDFDVDTFFGKQGRTNGEANFYLSNLYLPEYRKNRENLKHCLSQGNMPLSPFDITNYFCSIRQQTSIDEKKGTAKKHSLRSCRVINKDNEFEGEMFFKKDYENFFGLICKNVRKMGTKRNRGFGRVNIELYDCDSSQINIAENSIKWLEAKNETDKI